jgi:histidyl-tRNA synthetase
LRYEVATMSTLRSVKGMNDILPDEVTAWRHLEETFRAIATAHGYGEVRTPIVEPNALFVRSIGDTTDIVEKEMYTFEDQGEKLLSLRPEGTASAVRAFVQHSVHAQSPITKWFYIGPMYRRERPAKGRLRQFHQMGMEVYGDPGPFVDAEMIDMAVSFLAALGIVEVEVLVNSLGGAASRAAFREALLTFLEPKRTELCADCQRRMEKNPLRVLDCKVPTCAAIAAGAPSLLDYLDEADQAHFAGLKGALDALGTPYRVDPSVVRGLDYYTRTIFEVKGLGGDLGAQNTLLGGGRYDGMVKSMGGPDVPALGLGIGIERLLLAMPEKPTAQAPDAFIVALRPEQRTAALLLGKQLRAAGLRVENDLRGQSLKSQMRRSDSLGSRFALVLGESEVAAGTVQVKDLRASTQVELPVGEVAAAIQAALRG